MDTTSRCVLACVISIAALFVPAARAEAISITFVPAVQTVAGGPVDVTLRISGLADLAAPSLGTFDLEVMFTSTVLAVNTVTYGDQVLGDQLDLSGFGSITTTTLSTGFVELFELSLDSVADLNNLQAGDFDLATIEFNVLGSGVSSLSLTIIALGDATGLPLTASLGTGSVSVEGSVVPEPATLLMMTTGLVIGRRRFRRCA